MIEMFKDTLWKTLERAVEETDSSEFVKVGDTVR